MTLIAACVMSRVLTDDRWALKVERSSSQPMMNLSVKSTRLEWNLTNTNLCLYVGVNANPSWSNVMFHIFQKQLPKLLKLYIPSYLPLKLDRKRRK